MYVEVCFKMGLEDDLNAMDKEAHRTIKKLSEHYNTGYVTFMTHYIQLCDATRLGYYITNGTLPNMTDELAIKKAVLKNMVNNYKGSGTK